MRVDTRRTRRTRRGGSCVSIPGCRGCGNGFLQAPYEVPCESGRLLRSGPRVWEIEEKRIKPALELRDGGALVAHVVEQVPAVLSPMGCMWELCFSTSSGAGTWPRSVDH